MTLRAVLILGLVLAASLGASAPTSQSSSSSPSSSSSSSSSSRRSGYSDRYGLLEERNIFVRERASRRNGSGHSTGPSTLPAPRRPEEQFVLTGVVLEEDGYRAYVENDRGEVLRLAPGDKIARGCVAAIMIDAIAYDATPPANPTTAAAATTGPTITTTATATATSSTPAQRVWVEIGCDLTGKPSSMLAQSYSSSSSSSGSSTTGPTTGPAIPADLANRKLDDPTLTVEQRMRLRSALERQPK